MKKSNDLKQLRASKIDAQQGIVDTATADNREMNAEELQRFDALQTEIDDLSAQIERAVKFEANQAARAAAKGENVSAPAVHKSTKNERFSFVGAIRELASKKQLTGINAETNERGMEEMKSQGMSVDQEGLRLYIPSDVHERSQTVTGNSGADGGALVASNPRVVSPLAPNVNTLANLGVTVLDGLVGDVPLPTNELFSFGFVGETEDVAKTKVGFAGPTLKPKRVAGVAGISNQLLRQTSMSVEARILEEIRGASGRAIISAAINGAGGNAPTGIIDLITSNIETTATTPTKAIITKLEELVNSANGTNISRGYLSDHVLANVMKNIKVDAGSGRFLYEGEMLNGYKYEKTSLVPKLGVGDINHPLIFGDWAQMYLGYWGAASILVDPYTLASAGQTRMVIDRYADVAVTNEKSFAINKVLIDA